MISSVIFATDSPHNSRSKLYSIQIAPKLYMNSILGQIVDRIAKALAKAFLSESEISLRGLAADRKQGGIAAEIMALS